MAVSVGMMQRPCCPKRQMHARILSASLWTSPKPSIRVITTWLPSYSRDAALHPISSEGSQRPSMNGSPLEARLTPARSARRQPSCRETLGALLAPFKEIRQALRSQYADDRTADDLQSWQTRWDHFETQGGTRLRTNTAKTQVWARTSQARRILQIAGWDPQDSLGQLWPTDSRFLRRFAGTRGLGCSL